MHQCFVVLWIPRVTYLQFPSKAPYHNGTVKVNISDDPNIEFVIKIEEHNRDIDIYIQNEKNPESFDHFIKLEYMDFSHNGMVKYKFRSKFLNGGEFGFDENTFPEVVYHMIKSLYHIHDFHEDESDSSLKPFISLSDVDIHQYDNSALDWYLTEYETAVQNLVKEAQVVVRHAVELEKNHSEEEVRKQYESFLQMYVMVLGYDAYVSSLYKSIYNSKCHLNCEDKALRRRAFNIENAVKYFNVLYLFFDAKIRLANNYAILKKAEENISKSEKSIRETQKSAKSSTHWAIGSIGLSIVIAIGSIWYSICAANDSSRELETVKNELLNTLRSLEEPQKKINEVMSLMTDSLNYSGTTKSKGSDRSQAK